MVKSIFAALMASAIALLAACGKTGPTHTDDLTSGKIKISVDENYQFLADSEISTFTSLNKEAFITPSYKDEPSAFADLLKDSARVIMVNRELNPTEKAYFDSIKITPKTSMIAYDAVAFIINKSNADSNLTIGHLSNIFTGKTGKWGQINKASKLGDIQVVFDSKQSSNARFLMEKFAIKQFPANCQASNSNPNVIKYVQEHPNAIGVIGVNWISDRDDSTSMDFLSDIKVVNLAAATDTSFKHEFFPPLAGHLALKEYPLSREVYLIKREPYNGLGTGFVNFCYYDKGQRIVKLMGLLPSNIKAQVIRVKD
jgi:phosphate transport system substrate-binding protein